jgi:hypothetical protein
VAKDTKAQSGYEVGRPGGRCAVTGEPIAPGEKYYAALRETPAGFDRADVSDAAWPQFDRASVIAFWHTTMPQGEVKKRVFVDDEVLCTIFERLGHAEEQSKVNFRFVLGLILMRKRLIVCENITPRDGSEVWTVRFRGKQDLMDLINPNLGEEQIGEVTQHLGEVLSEEV